MTDMLAAGAALEGRGRLEEAIAEYSRLIDDGTGGAGAFVARAQLHGQRGDIAEAARDLAAAVALEPDDPWSRLRQGQLAWSMGRNLAAVEHMQAALDCPPHYDEMRVNLASCCSHVEWFDRAYRAALPLSTQLSDWWASAAREALTRYPAQRAETMALLRSRRTAPDMIERRWELAQRLFTLGRLRIARALCEGLMAEMPHSFPAFAFNARVIARQHGAAAAAAFLHSVAPLHRDSRDYPLALARYLHEDARFAEMLEASRGCPIDEASGELCYLKAIAMLALGRMDELRAFCAAWARAAPEALPPAGFMATAPWPRQVARPPRPAFPAMAASPRIIQFWDSPDVPADVRATMNSWKRLNPEAECSVFDDASARDYLATHFGSRAIEVYDLCHHIAMKVDYFRVAYLLNSGGVYADADELCLRPFGDLLRVDDCEIVACLSGEVPGYIHNWFLGARIGSTVMRHALTEAEEGVRKAAREGRKAQIWNATGPGLITRAVGRYLTGHPDQAPGAAVLMPLQQYRYLARTDVELAYKRSETQNWQLA